MVIMELPNLNYLAAFIRVADQLSFTRAAQELKVSQPAITKQISQLEQQLGLQLFFRDRRRVVLTPQGHELRHSIRGLHEELIRILQGLKQHQDTIEGRITVGSLRGFGQKVFGPMSLKFLNMNPKLSLDFQLLPPEQISELVLDGHLDFGIVTFAPENENLRVYHLATERIVLVTRAPSSIKFVKSQKALFVTYGQEDQLLNVFLKKHKKLANRIKDKTFLRVNSHRLMIEALKQNDAIAALPYAVVKEYLDRKELFIPFGFEFENKIYLMQREEEFLPQRKKAYREFLISESKKHRL